MALKNFTFRFSYFTLNEALTWDINAQVGELNDDYGKYVWNVTRSEYTYLRDPFFGILHTSLPFMFVWFREAYKDILLQIISNPIALQISRCIESETIFCYILLNIRQGGGGQIIFVRLNEFMIYFTTLSVSRPVSRRDSNRVPPKYDKNCMGLWANEILVFTNHGEQK
jgi:hypothetical protein